MENDSIARNDDISGIGPGYIDEDTDSEEPVNSLPISTEEHVANYDAIISHNGINDLCMLSNFTF